MKQNDNRSIIVYAHWSELDMPLRMGVLNVSVTRGKEVFYFEYNKEWLQSGNAQILDPELSLYSGPHYIPDDKVNFGLFLDSSPDRWGRMLMRRREAAQARSEGREPNSLYESDFLLGVFDKHRMGALRFKTTGEGDFLDNNSRLASPPWSALRELEFASLQLEKVDISEDPEYLSWLNMLMAPGSSLGGARPKSSVVDSNNQLWIAKFPSSNDLINTGAWEMVTHRLAKNAGLRVAESRAQKFSSQHHTFMTKRFDRTSNGRRIHYASALTMLGYKDGSNHSDGASYLELAEFLIQNGAQVNTDLEELWRRIVFSVCVSNTDDHLRNHGFILTKNGWMLSPAFDMNPEETGTSLSLNISEVDNSLNIDLALGVAEYFRLTKSRSEEILADVRTSVQQWREISGEYGISHMEQDMVSNAFSRAF